MGEGNSLRERLESSGWRRGSVLSQKLKKLIFAEAPPNSFAIVVSQDCDLVCDSTESEPFAEALLLRSIDNLDAQKISGRNPREMHLEGRYDDHDLILSAQAFERSLFDRNMIDGEVPDDGLRLNEKDVLHIFTWLAKRYFRPSRPTEFDTRIKGRIKKIAKALSNHGHSIQELLIRVEPGDRDLDSGTDYVARIMLLVEDPANQSQCEEAEKLRHRLIEIFNGTDDAAGIDGVDLVYCKTKVPSRLSVRDYGKFDTWDFDYLSAR